MFVKQILQHLERTNWAAVSIDGVKLGPGADLWQQVLDELTPEQLALLIEKIERFESRMLKKVSG